MPKDENIIISLSARDFNLYNNNMFKMIVDRYLASNPHLQMEKMIKGSDLTQVLLEVLTGDLCHVLDPEALYYQVEGIYDFWRDFKRFLVVDVKSSYFVNDMNYVRVFRDFNDFILDLYRRLCVNLVGYKFSVLRELPAGANALLLVEKSKMPYSAALADAFVIRDVVFRPPFIVYTKSNKRTGVFQQTEVNPLQDLKMKDSWFCYPILVGKERVAVYFPEKYLSLGLALSNLFEHDDEALDNKPDIIILFGNENNEGIYHDVKTDTYIAAITDREEIDYFGYLKKLILTAYNLKKIHQGYLPIHGACVSLTLKDQSVKNVVLMGDSGAGKSETLEALRALGKDEIISMTTVFDDMGTFVIEENELAAYGTETGAFLRTDDLENGYGYKVFDRAIFINPNQSNSRLVLPVAIYDSIIKGYKVDLFLYANNYEKSKDKLTFFNSPLEALTVFETGKRKAQGTTSEKGLVQTFFANPFGPVQEETKTRKIMQEYFNYFFLHQIPVGQIYTGLGLENGRMEPHYAAEALLAYLKGGKKQ